MKTKLLLLFLLLLMSTLSATTIKTDKTSYSAQDNIKITLTDMLGDPKDWVGIYPTGSSNEWENIRLWSFTDGIKNGTLSFESLPVGDYEARTFFKNSYELEASTAFSVKANNNEHTLSILQKEYDTNYVIQVKFSNMLGDSKDWIGVYPIGASNDWENVVAWKWTNGLKESSRFSLSPLPIGEYEVRSFFKNSYNVEAKDRFKVVLPHYLETKVQTRALEYTSNEDISIRFSHMLGDPKDWIAIYPIDASNAWENVVAWKWTGGEIGDTLNMGALPIGNYEVRAFFKNSYHVEATQTFSVLDIKDHALVKKAKEACLDQNEPTAYTLCANEENIVYLMQVVNDFNTEYKIYRINITPNSESIELTIHDSNLIRESTVEFRTLENTDLIVVRTVENAAARFDIDTFYHKGKDSQFSITYNTYIDHDRLRGTTETIENGQKLRISYQEYDGNRNEWINYVNIYNIENTANVTLISHTEI